MRTNTARVRIAERFLREILVLVRRFREVFLARKVRYGYIYIASIIAAASYSGTRALHKIILTAAASYSDARVLQIIAAA